MKSEVVKKWETVAGFTAYVVEYRDTYDSWRCGYVDVAGTSLYRVSEESDVLKDIYVHGGITFTGRLSTLEIPATWLVGFDCHHYMDTLENCPEDYVVSECESLAEQLARIL